MIHSLEKKTKPGTPNQGVGAARKTAGENRRLLAVRRHLGLFEDHVLTHDGIVLLELELALLGSLVLVRVVRVPGVGRRDEADSIAHGGVPVSWSSGGTQPRRPDLGRSRPLL